MTTHDPREPLVTVVMVPRERFGLTETVIERLHDLTHEPFHFVCVDAGAPRRVRRYLDRAAVEKGFTLVRSRRYLTPNQARNAGLAQVRTPYVAFVDNDLFVEPGWLAGLVACAEETGADLVGPLYMEGAESDRRIHMAGGVVTLGGDPARPSYHDGYLHAKDQLDDVEHVLARRRCDFVEFHAVLARTDLFDRVGTLDEELLNTREHLDLALLVHRAGGEVWVEPSVRLRFEQPPPMRLSDVPFYYRRWSETFADHSLDRFCDKHGFDDTIKANRAFVAHHRQKVLWPLQRVFTRLLGPRRGLKAFKLTVGRVETALNRRLVRTSRARRPVEVEVVASPLAAPAR